MALKTEILFERGSLKFSKSKLAAFGVENLLRATTWGAKGFKYNQFHATDRIHELHHPYHFYLTHGNRVLGNLTLDHRTVGHQKQKLNAYYVRYFAFNKAMQAVEGKNRGTKQVGILKQKLLGTMAESPYSTALNYNEDPALPAITYGFVDGKNLRSFTQGDNFGFETIREFKPLIFSRKNPDTIRGVRRPTQQEKPLIRHLLQSAYEKHSLVHFNYLFNENNYFILEYKGEIFAGCQVHLNTWKIHGVAGRQLDKIVFPLLRKSALNKFINPDNFKFLSFDSYFCKPGFEHVFFGLFESLLARFNVHMGMIALDTQDPLYEKLNNPSKLGGAHRFLKFKPGFVMAKGLNGTKISSELKSKPVFISGFDIT